MKSVLTTLNMVSRLSLLISIVICEMMVYKISFMIDSQKVFTMRKDLMLI